MSIVLTKWNLFIKTIIKNIEDVPSEVCNSLTDKTKGINENVKIF